MEIAAVAVPGVSRQLVEDAEGWVSSGGGVRMACGGTRCHALPRVRGRGRGVMAMMMVMVMLRGVIPGGS